MKALFNGKIYLSSGSFAQAMLFDKKIVAVGSNDDVLNAVPGGCERIDLEGRLVLPGFIDSHIHLLGMGMAMQSLDLSGARSINELIMQSKEYMKNHKGSGVLIGRGWNHDYFSDKRLPNRFDIDNITSDIPVVLTRVCGHIAVVNSKALECLNITELTQPPEGGSIDKLSDGRLSGILSENALSLLNRFYESSDNDGALDETLKFAFKCAAKNGVTSVHTNDIAAGNEKMVFNAYERVTHSEESLRVYHQCLFDNPADIQNFHDNGFSFRMGDDFNRIGPIKMLSDGSLGARTALLRKPYHDMPSTSGIACFSKEAHINMTSTAMKFGFPTVTHAIGDAAFEMCLDTIESAAKSGAMRHGIVHCQITSREQIERMAKLNIIAHTQPIFLHYDLHIVNDRVGDTLASTSYAFKDMLDLGIVETFGTDSPVEPINAINGIYCAVNRKDLAGLPENGWYARQCLSVAEAVDCYTKNGAYASFDEQIKGRLSKGFLADFVILDKDIFSCESMGIKSASVLATYVGGRKVYDK